MVHYVQPYFLAQIPPPICPKCGSHRTEIVGRSSNGETVILRCNTCGERSSIPAPIKSMLAQADVENRAGV